MVSFIFLVNVFHLNREEKVRQLYETYPQRYKYIMLVLKTEWVAFQEGRNEGRGITKRRGRANRADRSHELMF